MKANEYRLMAECVSTGVAFGLQRANKHAQTPLMTTTQQAALAEHLEREIMLAICEYFTFPVDSDGESV